MFTCRRTPIAVEPAVLAELERRYGEPARAYHTVTHVNEVLGWFDTVGEQVGWNHPTSVYLAILFHDAVYDPTAKGGDNERRSAALARELVGASSRVAELIEMTAHHGRFAPGDVDHDAAHFLDCDTAILGAAPAAFDAYDDQIAIEYGFAPPAEYRAGRRAFLTGMLARPRLFLSDYFHTRLDAPARANLARAIARLS